MTETITLSTGETLIVERTENALGHFVTIIGERDRTVAFVEKPHSDSSWRPATLSMCRVALRVDRVACYQETLTHAARLAVELDEQFVPGTEMKL